MGVGRVSTGSEPIDAAGWGPRSAGAAARREGIPATAWRVVNGEGDGLPSLIVDRYGSSVVAQLLSAGLESVRDDVVAALVEALRPRPEGILLRHDAPIRRHEGLALEAVPPFAPRPETAVL